ncbi:MAG: alcohol dehydrogenase catalytic domain-containing protein [Halanaeroarchaeum sp.]
MSPDAETMRAVGFHEHGDVDDLELLDVPVPETGPGDVLVDVRATALNHQDLFAVRELDHYITDYPFWGGGDVAGVVAEVGEDVETWSPGDRVVLNSRIACRECERCLAGEQSMCRNLQVLGEHRRGGFAEYVAVPGRNVHAVPDDYPLTEAAALPIGAGTAWRGLATRGGIGPEDEVLIVGATGGVGSYAVQIAVDVVGADTVHATTSTGDKAARLEAMGVDNVIDYTETDFSRAVWEATDGTGVDLVYNTVGGDTWTKSMRSLRNGGRLVTSGATAGPNPETELRLVFMRQLEIVGSTSHSHRDFEDVLSLAWSGAIEPVIQETFPLESFERPFEMMANRSLYGKVVLTQ